MRIPLFAALILVVAPLAACVSSLPQQSPALTPVRTVILMRHGVRPATRAVIVPEGYAAQPWASWDTAPGILTAHGYQGEVLLGTFDRGFFAETGLIAPGPCPSAGQVQVWADTDQRTRESGRAWLEGLYPGCDIPVGHSNGQRDDPLFAAIDLAVAGHDPAAARAAVEVRAGGSLDGTMPALDEAFQRLDEILNCCSVAVCEEAGLQAGCDLGDIPHRWQATDPHRRVDFEGPLAIGGTAGQTIMLEYLEGKPMSEVGWGRATETDFVLMSAIHAAEFDLLARTPYIADRGATPILRTVLANFTDEASPRLEALVGHDTNVGNVGGMLDVHWQATGYARDDAAVGGMLGFVLLTDSLGDRFVRVFYHAQSARQLRDLKPLGDDSQPYFAWLEQPLCSMPQDPTLCRADDFMTAVGARLTP